MRYPKGCEPQSLTTYQPDGQPFTLFRDPLASTLVITYGRLFGNALQAAKRLRAKHPVSILKLTRIHPIPEEVLSIAAAYPRVIFFEEGARAGGVAQQLGAALLHLRYDGVYDPVAIDTIVPHCSVEDGLKLTGLDVDGMVRRIFGEATGRAE